MKSFLSRLVASLVLACVSGLAAAGPASVGAEALERAYRLAERTSGGRLVESGAARATSMGVLEGLAKKNGEGVFQIVGDAGLEFLRAAPRFGDDFVQLGFKASPAGRRALAMNADELMPLARDFGVAAIEAEAKAPRIGRRLFEIFGREEGARLAWEAPAADIPRLLRYGEKSAHEATRQALLKAYRQEGASLFERIPPKLVLNAGLSAAMIIEATGVFGTFQAIADFIREHPYLFMLGIVLCSGACVFAWRFGGSVRGWTGSKA